jgi:aminomethyltransferase
MADTGTLKTLPLDALHREAGARFGAFAGWSMPLTYPDGVMKEHLHAREKAGLFDISHMKLFLVTGSGAAAALARACPFDPEALAEGQSKYTFFLNDTAGIIDDLIVTRLGPERFMVVANAGNAETDEAHLKAAAGDFNADVEPLDRVFLALQGPDAEAVLKEAGLDLSALTFMRGLEPRENWFATRSGYTGEDGFEIAVPPSEAETFARQLLADERVKWIGLAARDSLRLEAGLCLHGQDIDQETTPAEAGLMWSVPRSVREEGNYIGAAYLTGGLAKPLRRKRVGLKAEGRQPVRAGTILLDEDGAEIGYVTSGGFGPSAGFPVAMGYVAGDTSPGRQLQADVRGKRLPVTIHPLPFIPHRYRKG